MSRINIKSILVSLILPVAVIVSFFGIVNTTHAQSADSLEAIASKTAWEARDLKSQIKIYQTYLALASCFSDSPLKDSGAGVGGDRIGPTSATTFKWFNDPAGTEQGTVTYIGDNLLNSKSNLLGIDTSSGSAVQCWSESAIKSMLTVLEVSTASGVGALCSLGFDRNKSSGGAGGCLSPDGTGDFYFKNDSRADTFAVFKGFFSRKFWAGGEPYLTKAAQYQRYFDLFQICAVDYSSRLAADINALRTTDRGYEIYVIDTLTGLRSENKVFWYGEEGTGRPRSDQLAIGGGTSAVNGIATTIISVAFGPLAIGALANFNAVQDADSIKVKMSCAELETKINELSGDYAAYVDKLLDSGGSLPGNDENCKASGASAADCIVPDASSCAIDGIGWIVCPTINFLADVADGAFGFLADNFLRTDPKVFDTSTSTYGAWVIMRNIANVAFVITFLIIIFSQLTSVGISNYGVKKMLPRLVIAAILVNISYFVCQIAVDLSNILGYSIKELMEGLGAQAIAENSNLAIQNSSPGWASGNGLFGTIGTGVLLITSAAILYPLIATLIPVLLAAVVALVMILFILVTRQVLILLLIVVSPLAFVAFLLPNTEDWFKKWQKALMAMLLLFPIIALVFGVSSFASGVLSDAFNGGFADDTNNWFGQIIAAAVMILPLFIVPGLLKKALDGVGSIGTKLNGFATKAGGGLGGAYKNSDWNKFRQEKKAETRANIRAGTYHGKSPTRRLRSFVNRGINTPLTRDDDGNITGGTRLGTVFNKVTGDYGQVKGGGVKRLEREEIAKGAEKLASDIQSDGFSKDPKANFDATLTRYRIVHSDPKATDQQKREARIAHGSAQLYLTRTLGKEGADYINSKRPNTNTTPVTPAPDPNPNTPDGGDTWNSS